MYQKTAVIKMNMIEAVDMKTCNFRLCVISGLVVLIAGFARAQKAETKIPRLAKQGTAVQLIVDGKPFLILGGELGNSSASNLEYLRPYWQNFTKMNLNTILCPVTWETIEPREGVFDFTLVDSIIVSARRHDLRLVMLWFGSWKNSMSCYAPIWVKTDPKRFPRARSADGKAVEILTPFSDHNQYADARAFSALMKHIREADEKEHTVVMIQVENEIGMIPDARDYCDQANASFTQQVPLRLMTYLQKNKKTLNPELMKIWEKNGCKFSGTWEQVFGKGLRTDEIFMAWHFGRFTNAVTEAGKKEYPLPMYVNAALIRPNTRPGQYPSAGPLPHLMDVWRAAAPQIDFLAPDSYFRSFVEWCEKYDRSGNPLFIPEVGNDQSAANAFYAIAEHNAMGYSPFSIESLDNPSANLLSKAYDVLNQLEPLILKNQGGHAMAGALLDSAQHETAVRLGGYTFHVRHEYSWPYARRQEGETPRFGGMIIMLSPDEFLIAGCGIVVTFETRNREDGIAGIGRIEEGGFDGGKWMPGRLMNGDQSHQGRHLYLPGGTYGIQKIKMYKYK
jgi:beta-galactosidase GanA